MTQAPKHAVHWITLAVTILLALAAAVASYSTTKTTTDQHERRITVLEQDTVKTREMDEVHKQLGRIEDKLDKALEKK